MVHQFKFGDMNVVIDSVSGSVHSVDDMAFDMIARYKDGRERAVREAAEKYGVAEREAEECFDQIRELEAAGKLFKEDQFENIAGKLKERTAGVIKALCLHVAHTCNLNCSYCFANQGKYKGERAVMPFEVGKRALDFLVENSASRRNLEVDFFGGEPLMNFGVVKDLVKYARGIEKEKGKNFRFTLTTNGMLIDDDVIDFCNREMSNVVLSLDGRKEVHDRFRVDHAGNGSFDRVVEKFKKLVDARGGKNYYIRGTFTHFNPDFTEDVKAMLDLGFRELSLEPVVCDPGDECALTEKDFPIVCGQYEKLAEMMMKKDEEGDPFTFYHYMIDLEGGPCIYKRVSGCGSGTEYLAVTPQGDLYPCHQFVGDEKFKLGDIYSGITKPAVQKEFYECNAYAREECKDCWARLYCSGGCAANAYHATGSVKGVYEYGCRLFKKRTECAVALAVYRALKGKK